MVQITILSIIGTMPMVQIVTIVTLVTLVIAPPYYSVSLVVEKLSQLLSWWLSTPVSFLLGFVTCSWSIVYPELTKTKTIAKVGNNFQEKKLEKTIPPDPVGPLCCWRPATGTSTWSRSSSTSMPGSTCSTRRPGSRVPCICICIFNCICISMCWSVTLYLYLNL